MSLPEPDLDLMVTKTWKELPRTEYTIRLEDGFLLTLIGPSGGEIRITNVRQLLFDLTKIHDAQEGS